MLEEKISESFSMISNLLGYEVNKSLVEKYEKAKEELLPYFGDGGKLSIELNPFDSIDVSVITPILEEIDRSDSFDKKFSSGSCSTFLIKALKALTCRFEPEDFLCNSLSHDYNFPFLTKPVTKGIKFSKVLGLVDYNLLSRFASFFAYKPTPEFTTNIQTVYSQFLQIAQSRKQTIVLSIDPLDFFLVSASTTSWSSCHNWEDGAYRAGTFSYMCDKVSAVAYAYEKEKVYYGFDLPSKIWRQMVFFDLVNSSAILSKEYPSENLTCTKYTRKLAAKVLAEREGIEYRWMYKQVYYCASSKCEEEEEDKGYPSLHIVNKGRGYQDPAAAIIKMKDGGKFPSVAIGCIYPCPMCGRKHDGESDSLVCDNCTETTYRCCNCEDTFTEDNINWVDDEYYCNTCYNERFVTCTHCHNSTIEIERSTVVDNKHYCERCADRLIVTCDGCEADYLVRQVTYVDCGNVSMCDSCLDEKYQYCYHCKSYFDKRNVIVFLLERSV